VLESPAFALIAPDSDSCYLFFFFFLSFQHPSTISFQQQLFIFASIQQFFFLLCFYFASFSSSSSTLNPLLKFFKMLYSALPILAAVAAVNAQGVTSKISPSTPAPSGCVPNRNGKFGLNIVPIGKNAKRQLSTSTITSTSSFTSTLPAILSTSTITSTSSDIITLPDQSTLSPVTKPSSTSTETITISS